MSTSPLPHAPEDPAAGVDRVKSMRSFAEFYPFYLGEHRHRTCRRLHFVGSTLGLLYSFMGDWVMYKDIWTGKIRF